MTDDLMTFFAHKNSRPFKPGIFLFNLFKVKALYFSHDKKR